MRKYLKYKDSEVQWIGEIPENWAVRRINSLFKQRSETVSDKDFSPLSVTKNGILPQIEGVAKTENNDARKLVRKGDFVINSRSDRKGSSGTSRYDGSVSVINIVLEPHSIDPIYAEFLFKSNEFVEEYFRNGKGIVWDLWSTRYSEMKYILIPSPPLPEQQKIATYLDQKTTLIDQIISSSEKKIELIKEQRTATINHAVTKGLNPKVKMKDSGVEWIGEIPEGWVVTKMKHIVNYFGGGTPSRENAKFWNGTIPWVTPKDMKVDLICSSEEKITTDGLNASSTKLCPTNSLLIVIRSGILQRIIPIGIVMNEVTINQDIKCLITKNKGAFSEKYLFYFIKGNEQNLLSEWVKDGTTVESIEMESFINQSTPLPNLKEQQQIVTYLDQKTKEIDDLIASEKKRIELLKEYRQSLISEVVTGKIKVFNDKH